MTSNPPPHLIWLAVSWVLIALNIPLLLRIGGQLDSSNWSVVLIVGAMIGVLSGILWGRLHHRDAIKKIWLLLGWGLLTMTLLFTLFLGITTPSLSNFEQGWYTPERQPQVGSYRWTGPDREATISFDTPIIAHDLDISFNVLFAITPETLNSMQVFVNDQPLSLARRDETDRVHFTGKVPRDILNGSQTSNIMRFSVNQTVSPAEINLNTDERKLGIAVNRLAFYPAIMPNSIMRTPWSLTEINFLLGLVGFVITVTGLFWQAKPWTSRLIWDNGIDLGGQADAQLLVLTILTISGMVVALIVIKLFAIDRQLPFLNQVNIMLGASIVALLSGLVLNLIKPSQTKLLVFAGTGLVTLAIVPGLWPAPYNPSQFIQGEGWHPPIDNLWYGALHWTGPETRSRLYFSKPDGADDLTIGFEIPYAMTPDIFSSLSLSVNNQPISLEYSRLGIPQTPIIKGQIPAAILYAGSGTNELILDVNRTISPKELGWDENSSKFGVAVSQLKLNPIKYGHIVSILNFLITERQLMLVIVGLVMVSTGLFWKLWQIRLAIRTWPWQPRQVLTWLRFDSSVVWRKFLLLWVQLGLLSLVAQVYELHHPIFYQTIMPLVLVGFPIYYFLPRSWHQPFLVLLSLIAIASVFDFPASLWLVGISLGLIGLCHLPVAFWLRSVIILLAGLALVLLRIGWFPSPWSQIIWPVLGSMLMFRLILYLFDLKHRQTPVNITQTLAYFFLLPNIAFLLFPPIDFQTFDRSYLNQERHSIFQTGVNRILHGFIYLFLHRLVVIYFPATLGEVNTLTELIIYLIATFSFTIELFGQFHIIIGLLNLFGYNLPPVTQYFYLSPGFSDIWRRVSIYWRDFIQRLFLYPAYFWVRGWSGSRSLLLAGLFAFIMTWFFHAYQWFWLKGTFLLIWTDILFWTTLAGLLLAEVSFETPRGQQLKRQTNLSWWEALQLGVRTAVVMTIFCILWSLWTSPSVGSWLALPTTVTIRPGEMALVGISWLGMVVIFGFIHRFRSRSGKMLAESSPKTSYKAAIVTMVSLLLIIVVQPIVNARLPFQVRLISYNLQNAGLSDRDQALIRQGYYENLQINWLTTDLNAHDFASTTGYTNLSDTPIYRLLGSYRYDELQPSREIVFNGVPFKTNRWGLRDQDYEKLPPPNTCRIALLGASVEVGEGVVQERNFESLLEQRLNEEYSAAKDSHFEILNFSVSGRTLLQQVAVLEEEVAPFAPKVAIIVIHPNFIYNHRYIEQAKGQAAAFHLIRIIRGGIQIPYPELAEIVSRAEIDQDVSNLEIYQRLRPFDDELMTWAIREIAGISQQHDIQPVLLFLPEAEPVDPQKAEFINGKVEMLTRAAQEEGVVVINLLNVFEGQEPTALQLGGVDLDHPNGYGHQLIADRLYEALTANEKIIPRNQVSSEKGN